MGLSVPAATILLPSVFVAMHIQDITLGEPVSLQVEPSSVLTRIRSPTVNLVNANIFEPSGVTRTSLAATELAVHVVAPSVLVQMSSRLVPITFEPSVDIEIAPQWPTPPLMSSFTKSPMPAAPPKRQSNKPNMLDMA